MTSVPAKSEQTEYAVFELKPCQQGRASSPYWYCEGAFGRICAGCQHDGTRVDLSSGVKVEHRTVGSLFAPIDCWVAVPSTEEPTDGA